VTHNPATPSPLEGQRILLVEDEAIVSMILEDFLTEFGCEIVGPATRLKKAVDLASVENVDAALLDLNVSGEVTYDVAKILSDRGIPFAFVTGYTAASLSAPYRERPMLQKPFQSAQLRKLLTLLLKQRHRGVA
jgi:DNA-binding response OmpR family regulator